VASTFTYTGQSIGPEYPTRLIVVGVASLTISPVSSVTVGGIAATLVTRATGAFNVEFWQADVPTGTTASIVVTTPPTGSNQRMSVSTWALYDLHSHTVAATADSTASPGSVSITIRPRSVVLAMATNNQSAATFAWDQPGEDYQTNISLGGLVPRTGFSAITGSTSISVTYAPSASTPVLLAASWR
jgi:hypothetical protein